MADLAAALNPQIPLGTQVPQTQSLAINPIEMMGHLALMQNQLNQARLFQQTFAAKMQAGQIISQSPDLDTGVKNLMSNPSVMGFAPEIANVLRQFQLAGAQISGENLKQSQSAFHFAQQMLPMIVANPQSAGYVFDAARKMLPQGGANAAANEALNDLIMATTNGTNNPGMTPAQVNGKLQANATGIMASAGMPGESFNQVFGTNELPSTGAGLLPIVRASPGMGGGITQTGPVIPTYAAPTFHQFPGGAVAPIGAYGQPGGPPQPGGSLAAPQQGAQTGSGQVAAPATATLAGDGKPLFGSEGPPRIQFQGQGIGGPILTTGQIDAHQEALKDFNTTGLKQFQNAQITLGTLAEQRDELNQIAKGGGMLEPGAMAEARLNLAKTANMVYGLLGSDKLPFDVNKIGNAEALMKNTWLMGLSLTSQYLGQQREAANTLNRTAQAVPNIENTWMGGMLVNRLVEAISEHTLDQRAYQSRAMQANYGYMPGNTVDTFNVEHPMSGYISSAYTKYANDIKAGFHNGQISQSDAMKILKALPSPGPAAPVGGAP